MIIPICTCGRISFSSNPASVKGEYWTWRVGTNSSGRAWRNHFVSKPILVKRWVYMIIFKAILQAIDKFNLYS